MDRQQPPSESRDGAVSGYVKATVGRDPAESLARLRTMRDSSAQLDALTEGRRYWGGRDRTAAEAWLNDSTELTLAERAALNASRSR